MALFTLAKTVKFSTLKPALFFFGAFGFILHG